MFEILKTLGKAFGIIALFFAISGAYFLIKPTEEDKYMNEQMKMYPLGFHCTDEKDETVVIQFDMKSQVSLSTDKKVHKYTTENALYKDGEKNPFGCELSITDNNQQNIIIYLDDGTGSLPDNIRYEPSDDKDLIYKIVEKSVKKKLNNIRIRL